MNRNLLAAAGVVWTLSGAACAGEMGSDTGTGSSAKGSTGDRDGNAPLKKKESTRAPVQAAPTESKTTEDATARAADPKAPSGALIIDTPSGKLR